MHPLLFQIPLGSTKVVLFGHAFSLGSLDVSAFGALLAAGLLLGIVITLRLAERAGLERHAVLTICLTAFFVGLLGARFGFVVLHPALWESFGDAVSVQGGGLSSTFGIVSGGAAALGLAWRRGLPARTLFDAAAPGFALAVALGRLGCFLEGCDFGKPLSPSAPHWLARVAVAGVGCASELGLARADRACLFARAPE